MATKTSSSFQVFPFKPQNSCQPGQRTRCHHVNSKATFCRTLAVNASATKLTTAMCYDRPALQANLKFQLPQLSVRSFVFILMATQMTSLVQAKDIVLNEQIQQVPYQINVGLYGDETFTNPLPQTHAFTTTDTIFIEVC